MAFTLKQGSPLSIARYAVLLTLALTLVARNSSATTHHPIGNLPPNAPSPAIASQHQDLVGRDLPPARSVAPTATGSVPLAVESLGPSASLGADGAGSVNEEGEATKAEEDASSDTGSVSDLDSSHTLNSSAAIATRTNLSYMTQTTTLPGTGLAAVQHTHAVGPQGIPDIYGRVVGAVLVLVPESDNDSLGASASASNANTSLTSASGSGSDSEAGSTSRVASDPDSAMVGVDAQTQHEDNREKLGGLSGQGESIASPTGNGSEPSSTGGEAGASGSGSGAGSGGAGSSQNSGEGGVTAAPQRVGAEDRQIGESGSRIFAVVDGSTLYEHTKPTGSP